MDTKGAVNVSNREPFMAALSSILIRFIGGSNTSPPDAVVGVLQTDVVVVLRLLRGVEVVVAFFADLESVFDGAIVF